MRPIDKETAQTILEPIIDKIRNAIKNAVNGYYQGNTYSASRYRHSARTAANICHDEIIEEIKRELDGTTGVRFQSKKGLFVVIVNGIVVLRFKKFNNKLLSSGVVTQQSMAFNLQDSVQLEFEEEMPPDGLLHIGYIVNKLKSGVSGVYVTYRYGNNNVWTWDITAEKVAETVTFPAEVASLPQRRIKAKDQATGVGDVNVTGT